MFKALNYTVEEFQQLKSHELCEQIVNTEADFFIAPGKPKRIIKRYKNIGKIKWHNKIKTVFELKQIQKDLNMPELILMDRVVLVNDIPIGFGMLFAEGKNANIVLNANNVPLEIKILVLKQIGQILSKIATYENKYGLSYGDVHEGNFIFNFKEAFTYGVDTDSMKINGNDPFPSMYMILNHNLDKLPKKYMRSKKGVYMPNSGTDIYNFIVIILNTICDGEIYSLGIDNYYRYLDYLSDLGFDSNLLTAFASIYENGKTNINPLPYLDTITEIPNSASLGTFRGKGRLK